MRRYLLILLLSLSLPLIHCTKKFLRIEEGDLLVPDEFKLPAETASNLEPEVVPPTGTEIAPKPAVKKPKATKPVVPVSLPDFKGSLPFQEKERLQYLLSYFALKGGIITMEVRPATTFQDRPVLSFWGHVKSSYLVDLFYRVDDSIDVLMDQQKFLPVRGSFQLNETAQVKQRVVLYDHVKGQAKFWSKGIYKDRGPEEINRVDQMTPGSQEMFSSFYYVRMLRPEVGKTYKLSVYENNQNIGVEVRGLKEETVWTRLGRIRCVKSQVTTTIGGVLQQTGEIYLWLSTEPDAAMVKFSAKIKLGEIKGILIRKSTTDQRLDLSM